MNGQTMVKALVRLPLGATAVYNSSGLAYIRHTDHLGSSRLATTPARAMYASAAYAPYGEAYAVQGTTDLSFTGQDQDTTSGMYDFMVRKYNPVQGRWLSPDPAGLGAVDPANPQTWNRYAYVGNNPLSLIDPLGADAYEGCQTNPACYYIDPWGLRYAMSGWSDPFQMMDINVRYSTSVSVDGGCLGCGRGFDILGAFTVPSLASFPNFPDPPLPQKACAFTANAAGVPPEARQAIQEIYNNAGVGIDFNGGSKPDLTVSIAPLYVDPNGPGTLWGVDGDGVHPSSNAAVNLPRFFPSAVSFGIVIAHEWGHYLIPCGHTAVGGCGQVGLMRPGSGLGPPSAGWTAQDPGLQFTSGPGSQAEAIQRKCNALHPSAS